MATPRTVPQTEWRSFFDVMSKSLLGKRAEVETVTLDLGDQIIAEWLPLIGITYDSHNDLLDVAIEGPSPLDHLIRRPREIVLFEGTGIESVSVVRQDGTTEIIRFKEPLLLPAANAGS